MNNLATKTIRDEFATDHHGLHCPTIKTRCKSSFASPMEIGLLDSEWMFKWYRIKAPTICAFPCRPCIQTILVIICLLSKKKQCIRH